MSIADINRKAFSLRSVGSWYERQNDRLDPDEHAALVWALAHRPAINDLLDLGVGAGRTTRQLQEVTQNYVGVDFSDDMIAICQRRFPAVDFRVADARSLDMFPDRSFDMVFFSFNGIDYVDQEGRLRIIATVRRILRNGGTFVFSSHNRNAAKCSLWRAPGKPLVHQAKVLLRFIVFLPLLAVAGVRHLQYRKHERRTDEYEIRNDIGHGYRMLTYYISPEAQIAQLVRAGFDDVQAFDTSGYHIDPAKSVNKSPWLCYVATKVS